MLHDNATFHIRSLSSDLLLRTLLIIDRTHSQAWKLLRRVPFQTFGFLAMGERSSSTFGLKAHV